MRLIKRNLLFAASAALLGGCGYATKGYRTQSLAAAPREANCPLQIFTVEPKTGTREVGVVEFKRRKLGRLPATELEAREKAYAYACLAGGNGILMVPNRRGNYSKATILDMPDKKPEE